jgi:FtsH-binding integral membrane protein
MGCAGMIGISLASMFWPSPALYNMWLYGGLVLFSAFVLYDTQKIIHNAKSKPRYDPISESIGIYLDTIILFERFLIIFMNNKKK